MPEPLDNRGKDYDEYLLYRSNPFRPDVWSVQRNSYRDYEDLQPLTIWFDGTLTQVRNRLQVWTKPRPDYYGGFVEVRYFLIRQDWED